MDKRELIDWHYRLYHLYYLRQIRGTVGWKHCWDVLHQAYVYMLESYNPTKHNSDKGEWTTHLKKAFEWKVKRAIRKISGQERSRGMVGRSNDG